MATHVLSTTRGSRGGGRFAKMRYIPVNNGVATDLGKAAKSGDIVLKACPILVTHIKISMFLANPHPSTTTVRRHV
jgi:hypothetical protein